MITAFFSLCIVIVFMHFAHELEEKLSTTYNYKQNTQPPCSVSTVWNDTYLVQEHSTEAV